jgi:hypothetical protein
MISISNQNYLPDPLFWLSQDNYRTYNREVAKLLGIYAAIFLSELASKQRYHTDRGEVTPEGFFYFTQPDMEDRTCLTRDQQEKAVSILCKHNLIEKRIMGIPSKRFFRVNGHAINELFFGKKQEKEPPQSISASMVESCNLGRWKVTSKGGGKSHPLIYTNNIEEQHKRVIIAEPEQTPAAGNNNLSKKKQAEKKIYPCLKDVDLPKRTKESISAEHSEAAVVYATKLLTHPDSKYHGKPGSQVAGLIQDALEDPGRYKDYIDNLGQPKLTKAQERAKEAELEASDKESKRQIREKAVKEAVSGFKDKQTYNGYRCVNRNGAISFYPPITDDPNSKFPSGTIDFQETDFVQKLHKLLKKLGVDIPPKV